MSTLWSEVLRRSRHQRTKYQPYIFHTYTALDGGVHILLLWHRVPSSPQFSFSQAIYKGWHSLPLLRSLNWWHTFHVVLHKDSSGEQPLKAACVCLSVRYRYGAPFFIHPWCLGLELSLCLAHRRNIWNTSCPRTISFHLRMRWFVSYRGGVCSRVLNGVVGEWQGREGGI